MADLVIAQLLFLEYEDPDGDIMLYVHSPGGSVDAGLAVYDTMNFIRPDVSTICVGMAASMGALILTSGAKGKRYALPHARIMIHQVSAGVPFSQGTDVEIRAREILRYKALLTEIMARHTGKPIEEVSRDTERDYFMSSEQAKEYGLIDHVMTRQEHEQLRQQEESTR
jgi:ATP-dependent Clp protease protease subunit